LTAIAKDKASRNLTPPLKWAGGKRWLVPTLRELYAPHRHRRMVEPFVGGLAIGLGLLPDQALLADVNTHLINFYRQLARGLVVDQEMFNDSERYYQARTQFNALLRSGQGETAEAAQWFYYLNRTGYNGLCRFNNSDEFNVPFGKYKKLIYARDFLDYAPVLSKWAILCGDFECLPIEPDDFIYADPPYDVDFTKYSKNAFTWSDQERLARRLAAHPGPVVASNQATGRMVELYTGLGFQIDIVQAPRRISCDGDRTPASEMIAKKNL
jgi:DNA adenine methylase